MTPQMPVPVTVRLADLFGAFFRVGLTAFGMAILQSLRSTALRRGFVSEAEIEEVIALVQLYPGPIMVDLVAFIGYRRRGVPGALCAAAGLSWRPPGCSSRPRCSPCASSSGTCSRCSAPACCSGRQRCNSAWRSAQKSALAGRHLLRYFARPRTSARKSIPIDLVSPTRYL